jgi:hypothetical protein
MDEVERSLARPAIGRESEWSENLGNQLQKLSSALEQHVVTTESPKGLLTQIVEVAPRLKHRLDIALDDHIQLRRRLRAALDSLSAESR